MTRTGPEDLAVVIPTRDRSEILLRTLAALRAQSVPGFETIVVADGEDQTLPHLGDVRVLRQRHKGPGAARNTAVRATARPMVLFLGDDMVPDRDLVRRHLEAHRLHPAPEEAVLGRVEWHPEVRRNSVVRWLEVSGTQFDYENIDGSNAGWGRFYSCNVSLKRELLLSVGGFDEDFEFDYEDLDLGFRLNEKGLVLWYEPGAVARHLHPYDLEKLCRRYETRAGAERLMQRKHPWFDPYFAARVRHAAESPPASPAWLVMFRSGFASRTALGRIARQRTDTWFHQRLAQRFLATWEGDEDLCELKEYLGEGFDIGLLQSHRQVVDEEENNAEDEASFYRTSQMYLYDLTAFAMTGIKRPYLEALRSVVPPGAHLLDYGCGIGSDGLRLLREGYRVEFADFDNPSTSYLRWRLQRRGAVAAVHDLDDQVPGGFDAAYAFDVIEHTDEPFAFLGQLEQRSGIVAVNLLEHDESDTHLHRPLPIRSILDHATSKGLLHYRKYRSNSHLVIYRSEGAASVRSVCVRAGGEIAKRTSPWRSRAMRVLTS